jgi:phosphohistidine phosphatase
MQLLVVRHGIAEDSAASGRDADRALTDEGRRRVDAVARALVELGLRMDRVLHSPALRAAQTAERLAPLLDGQDARHAIAACGALAAPPGEALLAALQGERLTVVGHEPWLSQLVAWLAVGEPRAARAFDVRKASVAWLEGEPRPGRMTLRALLPARVLAGPRD